ncbi:hypothetical protein GN244_ATG19151 [Phytophthora infestans]|uniref:Uncharacterized protein n=1 Tax=Phytophthora infestans TaxID=4787 RepID=A0A833S595_PHYIN|nr:hypothetical protein GN244_ATG19151 [Phytophthora infestans]KAF4141473.1 hypothetical protein GN958_ATG09318 [Phytophthora infestans]
MVATRLKEFDRRLAVHELVAEVVGHPEISRPATSDGTPSSDPRPLFSFMRPSLCVRGAAVVGVGLAGCCERRSCAGSELPLDGAVDWPLVGGRPPDCGAATWWQRGSPQAF